MLKVTFMTSQPRTIYGSCILFYSNSMNEVKVLESASFISLGNELVPVERLKHIVKKDGRYCLTFMENTAVTDTVERLVVEGKMIRLVKDGETTIMEATIERIELID